MRGGKKLKMIKSRKPIFMIIDYWTVESAEV